MNSVPSGRTAADSGPTPRVRSAAWRRVFFTFGLLEPTRTIRPTNIASQSAEVGQICRVPSVSDPSIGFVNGSSRNSAFSARNLVTTSRVSGIENVQTE